MTDDDQDVGENTATAKMSSETPPTEDISEEQAIARAREVEAMDAEVTEAEAVAFGKKLEDAFRNRSRAAINRLVDASRIADCACAGLDLPEEGLAEFKAGLAAGFSGKASDGGTFVSTIFRECSRGGDHALVCADERKGVRRAVFRIVGKGGGMNYYAYRLERNPSGQVVAYDIDVKATAESVSETMRRMVVGPSGTLAQSEREAAEAEEASIAMTNALAQGRYAEALRLYETLPESMQRTRPFMIVKVVAASQIDEQFYLEVVRDYQSMYANDGCLALMLIDYYFRKGDGEKILDAVETLYAEIPDPFLNIFRANGYFLKNDLDSAREHIDRFVADFPRFMNGHDIQAAIALKQGDFPAVTKALKVLYGRFNINPIVVANLPLYAPYKKSEEYKKLLNYLEEQPKNPEPTTLIPSP